MRLSSKARRTSPSTALILCLLLLASANRVCGQDGPSVAQAARQARADRSRNQVENTNAAASGSTEVIDQDEDGSESIPDGFQNYDADGYRVLVPAPFSAEGRDERGTLVATSVVTGITTKVFAGVPIPISQHPTQTEFMTILQQHWGEYGRFSCDNPKAGIPDHRCVGYGTLFGTQFRADARIIDTGDRLIPVLCFATTLPDEAIDLKKIYVPAYRADAAARMKSNNDKHSMAAYSSTLCQTVLNSVHPAQRTLLLRRPASRPAPAQPVALTQTPTDSPSLGDVARASKSQAAQAKVKITVEAENTIGQAPSGFRVRSSSRCTSAGCWQERLFLPLNARRVSGGNSDNVYVVGSDDKTTMVIYFGSTTVSYGYSNYGTAADLAYRWIHAHADYTAKPIASFRTMNGHSVTVVRTRLLSNLTPWTEESAELGKDPVNFKIACIAPEDQFADLEFICSTIVDSWRLDPQ